MSKRVGLALALFCCVGTQLRATELTPYLVKDVNQVPAPAHGRPEDLQSFGSTAVFSAEDDDTGRELWRSDGTEAGTYRLLDGCAGECAGGVRWLAATPRGGFFRSSNGQSAGLWLTDGTSAGTLELRRGLAFSTDVPFGVWVAGLGRLFFVATDGVEPRQLWTSDGTAAGTQAVVSGLHIRELRSFRDRLYFSAFDAAHGYALWTSDGTAAGTRLVKDVWPGSSDGAMGPSMLQVVGNTLLFVADSPRRGIELWKSDGTSKGTVMLANLTRGAGSTTFHHVRVLGSRAYYIANAGAGQELLVTDGTAKGTLFVTSFAPAEPFGWYLWIGSFGQLAVFLAADGVHGAEPWITDGKPRGTRLLADVCTGSCSSNTELFPLALGSRLILSLNDGQRGAEPWALDAPTATPHLLRDICPGPCSAGVYANRVVGERMVFAATAERPGSAGMWVTDGTSAGTLPLADSRNLEVPSTFTSAVAGGALFFAGRDDDHGLELWRTEGTPASTQRVRDIATNNVGGSRPSAMAAAGNRLFVFADDGIHGFELWRSDGTDTGTALVKELVDGENPQSPPSSLPAAALGEDLVFAYQHALWGSDGTAPGTTVLHQDATVFQDLRELTSAGGQVFLTARNDYFKRELWRTDGTGSGTRLVKAGDEPHGLVAFAGRLFFTASSDEAGVELWQSDGTADGTRMVVDLLAGPGSASPLALTPTSNGLFFLAATADGGRAIWRTDGTAAGTLHVSDLSPSTVPGPSLVGASAGARAFFLMQSEILVTDGSEAGTRSIPVVPSVGNDFLPPFAFTGGWLYFAAPGEVQPVLWRTDGTVGATAPVRDPLGELVSLPSSLHAFAGRVVFTAAHGLDLSLWESDGTPGGTRPLFRLYDRPSSLFTDWPLAVAGGRLFFAGYSRESGLELWALRPE